MPVFLVILAMPFMIMLWIVRYFLRCRAQQEEAAMRAAIEKAEIEARCARPLRDYVASLKPGEPKRMPARPVSVASSPPTVGNIGRFTALTVCSGGHQYFVRDAEGTVYGPAEEPAMQQWIREGRIGTETTVSNHPEGPWLPAGQVRALRQIFQETVQAAVSSNRFDHIQIK